MANKEKIYNEDMPSNTKSTVGRILSRLGRQKGRLLLVLLATVLSSVAFATVPLLMGQAIDNLLPVLKSGASGEELLTLVSNAVLIPVVLLLIASAISGLLAYGQQYIIASVGEKLTFSLRQDISEKLNRLPLKYFDEHKTGDIMSRVTNDLEKVSAVMQVGLMQLISSAFTIVISCTIMLVLNPLLFLVTFVSVVACGIATNYVSWWSQRCNAKSMAVMGALGAKVEEVYSGNRVIKVFSQQNKVINEVCELGEAQFKANRQAQFADYAIYPSIRLLSQLGFVAVAVVGGVIALGGGMTLGAVQAFLQYVNQISEPVTQMAYVVTSLQAAIAGAERVFSLLDEDEDLETGNSSSDALTQGRVEFQDVQFGYNDERILIKNLNLEVLPNEMVAIVGPTGGGKTTLINLLMRFYELNSGTISIDGVDITSMPRSILRRKIGMVLQDTWLFDGTIAENISYGKQDATREEIIAAAKSASCDHFIRTLPHGYDTFISGEVALLSQGQMQLLTIARAMLMDPTILVLDEATSSVDTRTEVAIQKAMSRLMRGKTSFVIAHRLSTIQGADLILVVKEGDIVERGNHDSLMKKNGFYAALHHSQFAT